MRKKWWTAALLSALLIVTGCSGGDAGSSSGGPGSPKPGDRKTVTIAVQSSDRFLESAVQKFEALHPDIQIEIKEYLAVPDSGDGLRPATSQADLEKFVQTVTTEVMSGKGADLISMSGLPQEKMVDKKMLANLNDLMAEDSSFDKSKLYGNILEASRNGKGLYAMPLAFSIDVVQGNSDLLQQAKMAIDDKTWTWDEFRETVKKLQEREGADYVGIINLLPTQLLYDYINSNYSKLVQQGRANFDSDFFREMMSQIKSMYDEGALKDEFSYDYGKSLFSMGGFGNFEQALSMPANIEYFRKPTVDGNGQGSAFSVFFSLGLNSKSKVRPEAWEFLKFLLSDEVQSSPDLIGLPINRTVADNEIAAAKQGIENGTVSLPKRVPDAQTLAARIQTLKTLLSEAGMQQTSDMKVCSIANEEFQSYMSGQKTAEEVSRLIQNRVSTYLNE